MKIKLDKGAKCPTRAHSTDAGLDIYSREDKDIIPYGSAIFHTGVHVELPEGTVGFLKSKSGLNVTQDITSDGVIDSGYTGEILVKLYNHGEHTAHIRKNQKISQLVILPCYLEIPEVVDELDENTERGDKGFGSTGAF